MADQKLKKNDYDSAVNITFGCKLGSFYHL